uniref:Uncharacterized protein n=1 Tax=Trypanosoma vivax (strain Y486) TaxID=1055687 RepID=G0TYA6_TRYVY|nr:conserved hypothetical protein, fragment [Trypanosoma vivax Y486]
MNLHLHSVLLMALDVVKGPYLKCFAPTNPFDSTLEGGVSQPINAEFRNDSEGDNVSGTHCQPGGGKKLGFGFNAPPAVDRINTFSEVFVPRSEFCRRVMYLLEAESGLLYLFYPEEICGQRYQRKTLRYTLCFVFCVAHSFVANDGSSNQTIQKHHSEWTGSRVAGNNEHNKQQPLWWEDLQFAVLEALRHLEALNYVRVIKTCKMHCRYRVRNGLYRVMSDGNHSARRSLGERMCLVVKRLCRTDERAENGLQQQCLYGVGSSVAKPASVVATLTLPPALCDRAASYKGGVWEQHDKNRRNAPSHCSPSQFSLPSESVLSPSLVGWVSSGGNSYEKAGFCALQNNQEAVCPKGEIDLTAAAALCALGKFIGCSVSRVQKEMRRHPVWATALAGWKEACCKALVEVALINKWLEEVPYLTEPVVG